MVVGGGIVPRTGSSLCQKRLREPIAGQRKKGGNSRSQEKEEETEREKTIVLVQGALRSDGCKFKACIMLPVDVHSGLTMRCWITSWCVLSWGRQFLLLSASKECYLTPKQRTVVKTQPD